MPAYKGTKELPKASNKQARDMFTSMQKDREGMAKGRPDSVQRGEKGEGASMKKMAKGGFMATKFGKALAKKSDDTKGRAMVKKAGGGKCYAKGGSVSARADGVATKGKTKATMVKMAMGGAPANLSPARGPVNMNPTQSGSMAATKRQMMAPRSFGGIQRKKGGSC
jgi:hypothetical protein